MIGWVRVIAAAAFVLLAAGCTGGDADPPSTLPDISPSSAAPQSPEPTQTSTEEPEPTPTGETPPEPRDGMHEYSQAGVDAFTRYVIDVINYANRTNDIGLLQEISTDDCQFCARTLSQLTFIADQGGRLEGGQVEPTTKTFEIIGPAEGFETSAGVDVIITETRTIDGDGDIRDTAGEETLYIIFDLMRENERWRLAEARRTSER